MEENIRELLPGINNMKKDYLLLTIANKAYNIGFGAQMHFASYNIYCKIPRFLSLLTVLVGVVQLLTVYKELTTINCKECISAGLICIGILALLLDAGGKDKELYNQVGKRLTLFYNQLHSIYNEIKFLDEKEDLTVYKDRVEDIEKEFQEIAISYQAMFPFIHIYTNLRFFYGGLQIDWIDEQLHFKLKDKFPFFHPESFVLYFFVIVFAYYFLKTGFESIIGKVL